MIDKKISTGVHNVAVDSSAETRESRPMPNYEKYQRSSSGEAKHVSFKCPVAWIEMLVRNDVNVSAVCRDAIERIYEELQKAEALKATATKTSKARK